MNDEPHVRLDSYDKNEWYDVCRQLVPELTWEEYGPMWERFQIARADNFRNKELH